MKIYVDRTESGAYAIEVTFKGGEFREKDYPETTKVLVRLFKKTSSIPDNDVPYAECWRIFFEDVEIPKGIWNGVKLAQFAGNRIFVAIGNSLTELSFTTGEALHSYKFADTPILKIGSSADNSGILVMHKSAGKKNFFKISLDGKKTWQPEINTPDPTVCRFKQKDENWFVWTWDGHRLLIDDKTGEILNIEFVK
jgi:hypothetical protein